MLRPHNLSDVFLLIKYRPIDTRLNERKTDSSNASSKIIFASKTLKAGVRKAKEATPDAEYFLTNQNHNKNPKEAIQIP